MKQRIMNILGLHIPERIGDVDEEVAPDPLALPSKPGHLANQTLELSPYNQQLSVVDHQIRPSALEPRRSKVCIVGAGYFKNLAPFLDPTWEVWGLNACPSLDEFGRLRADVWFDLHQRCAQNRDDLKWIRDCRFPIYVPPDLMDEGPNTIRYPLDEIEARFGAYWSCTFAYQIALVLHMGTATDLGLYGVELAYGTARERTVEWACVAYWLGRAEQSGLRIHLPAISTLGRHFARYGFEYHDEINAVKQYTSRIELSEAARRQLLEQQRGQ